MDKKRNLRSSPRCQKKYRVVSSNNMIRGLITQKSNDEEYMADIEQLRKALEKIEKELYSSNIKLEQIEKKRHSKIIRAKVAEIFSPRKKVIKP
ncbi:MAG: hypothetical protein J6Q82_01565 [Clostridia bacterium]|nr:hypothetical protein [Clostridia bacterium]